MGSEVERKWTVDPLSVAVQRDISHVGQKTSQDHRDKRKLAIQLAQTNTHEEDAQSGRTILLHAFIQSQQDLR